MTESADDEQRPVSVAELLARNGAGDGKISGHRRRMRGNADAIPVAELTGEIPVIRDRKGGRTRPNPAPAPVTPPAPEPPGERSYLRSTEPALFGGDSMADEVARTGAVPKSGSDTLRSIFPPTPAPEARPGEPRKSIDFNDATGVIAPVVADSVPDTEVPKPAALVEPTPAPEQKPAPAPEPAPEPEPVAAPEPEYPDAWAHDEDEHEDHDHVEPGQDVHGEYGHAEDDDEHGYGGYAGDVHEYEEHDFQEHEYDDEHEYHGQDDEDWDESDEAEDHAAARVDRKAQIKRYLHMTWTAGQYLLAAAAGAALFKGFGELWRFQFGIAFAVGILFVLLLVAGLWAVRKTVDLVSILIAIVVGALIAFGPLVLNLQLIK